MAIYKIQASRVNNITATEFTGQENELGQIWYDPVDGILRLYDGNAGGKIINGGGNSTPSQLVNGNSNVVVYPNGNVAISVNGTSNVMVFSNPNAFTGNVIASGNVSAANVLADAYFYANGEPFSGGTNYSNANVAAYLPTNSANVGANNVTAAGTVTAAVFTATGNVTGTYFIGNGALLSGIAGTYSNANVAAYLPTYTGTLSPSTVSATGNITAAYFIGDGSQLTNVGGNAAFPPQAGNANAYLTTDGSAVQWQYLPGAFGLELDAGNAQTELEYVIDGGGA